MPDPLQAREEGPRAAAVPRGNPATECGGELPPGVTMNYGNPSQASPFIQLKLPSGMMFENKKSRSLSFIPDGGLRSLKSTVRTKECAAQCLRAWSWEWWSSLSGTQRNSIRALASKRCQSDDEAASSASKKQKKTAATA